MWIIYGVMIAFICLPLLSSRFRDRFPRYWHYSTLFPVCMWIVGGLAHALWSKHIWGHFYYSPDYVVDFLPFLPILQAQVETSFGDAHGQLLGGTSMTQLRLIWLSFSIPTWIASWFLFLMLRGLLRSASKSKEC
jgi:Na+-driven multidrug efflux pump